jgi:hypothetical protein
MALTVSYTEETKSRSRHHRPHSRDVYLTYDRDDRKGHLKTSWATEVGVEVRCEPGWGKSLQVGIRESSRRDGRIRQEIYWQDHRGGMTLIQLDRHSTRVTVAVNRGDAWDAPLAPMSSWKGYYR